MVKNFNKILLITFCMVLLFAVPPVMAQHSQEENGGSAGAGGKAAGEDEVSTVLNINSKDGSFGSTASFSFEVKNNYDTNQEGTISYIITTDKGQTVKTLSRPVNLGKKSTSKYDFEVPGLKMGFYKLNMMINVSDYDDTTRRAFGIRPEEIKSQYARPADFDQFWQNAKDELARVKPNYKVTELPSMNTNNRKVYEIEMKSLDNLTIRGYMTVPISKNKGKKFSVLLGLPGYQVKLYPIVGLDPDLVIITLNTRGQGTSRDVIHTERDAFISYRIEDKNKYVMRGVIMDCVRAVDFIYAQPNLRHDQILATGGSMGGYLALALAGLDHRVTLCSAQNPIMSDIRNLVGSVEWPINDIKKYVLGNPGVTFDQVLNNLDYYDTKNFAATIQCPTIMGLGLLDPYVPPGNGYAVYNSLNADKRLMVFKNLGHEVSQVYKDYEGRWMRDTFGLF
ncbi:cephalosporin-C deacetylase-like acetyl esterase [Mucilaginibacter oryzae]|uniref:Cephalosporin-C deacetylase-like acetyl esterase n=2 Tax=Mucilaginibacter oryzae TaxID=468058 RepID=A0A316HGW8_9SPHI|nr:cephalosporin-C deacetylase-like acetyl esterase [Mucilaginibacter oryzae]